MVIEALAVRFGQVPPDLQTIVMEIKVTERLKKLHRQAILADSMETFRQHLHDPQKN